MMFTNKRTYSAGSTNPTNTNIPTMKLMSRPMPSNVKIIQAEKYVEKVEKNTEKKKIRWGEPFWNLFHVLAEKVREESFFSIRESLLNLIFTICSNLPCPDCKNHAVSYLQGINFNNIRTKSELKLMLFHFHNAVNARKGFPIFPIDQLDQKYVNGRTVPIIEEFMKHFKYKHKSIRMIADDLHRTRVATSLTTWFQTNIMFFDS